MTGQAGQDAAPASRAVVVLAAVLALVLLTAVGVAALRTTSTANADTLLERGADAVLELADGSRRAAREGEAVPRGATVVAGTTGAVLQTRERRVHLAQDTEVTVVDGARQALRAGYVMVDASRGPGVEVSTEPAVVETAEGSLVRVVAGPLVRVGVLRGDGAEVRAAGRKVTSSVPLYYQSQVARGGLPTDPTPLLLTGDRFEQDLARELHLADRDLNALARRLDDAGAAGPAVLAVLSTVVPSAAPVPGAPGSERALGFLLAAAADADDAGGRYGEVRALRTAGGSWGVVAALVGTTPNDVSGVLAALLAPEAAPVLAAAPQGTSVADLLPDLVGRSSAPRPSAAPPAPSSAPEPTPGSGTPTPSQSPTPPATGVPLVDELVDTVLDLVLPDPVDAPAPAPTPTPTRTPLLDLPVQLPLLD